MAASEGNFENNTTRLNEAPVVMDSRKTYQLPENYNPADYPAVKLRNNNSDRSETQRKRRSKNRLSNRRSTGFISKDVLDEAMRIGPGSECIAASNH